MTARAVVLLITNCTFTACRTDGALVLNSTSVTITNSSFLGNAALGNGGAINSGDSRVKITYSHFRGNNATHGGAIYCDASQPNAYLEVRNCWLRENNAVGRGGAVAVNAGRVAIYNTSAHRHQAMHGGALHATVGGVLGFTSGSLYNNTALGFGGAAMSNGTMTFFDVQMWGNRAYRGGAVAVGKSGSLDAASATISSNRAYESGGGAACVAAATISLRASYVRANTASIHGGGLFLDTCVATLSTSLVGDNRANASGGGVRLQGGTFLTKDLTISGNVAADKGGGLSLNDIAGGTASMFYLQNARILNNTATFGGGFYTTALNIQFQPGSLLCGNSAALTGGGFHAAGTSTDRAAVTSIGLTLSNNTATQYGGAMYLSMGLFQSANSSVLYNSAASGGGAYLTSSTLNAVTSVVAYNSATDGGGIYAFSSSTASFGGGNLTGNTALQTGGGVEAMLSTIMVDSTTISFNSARLGGGLGLGAGSALVCTNALITDNTAAVDGAGSYFNGLTWATTRTRFLRNRAGNSGAGVYWTQGAASLTTSYFEANSASVGAGAYGFASQQINISQCTFNSNTAGSGGALGLNIASATVTGTVFNGNSASGLAQSWGGAVYCTGQAAHVLTVGNVTLRGNAATQGRGGALGVAGCLLQASSLLVADNVARVGGGITYQDDVGGGIGCLRDAVFSNNTAYTNGGGLYTRVGTLLTRDCTFDLNQASGDGGGVYVDVALAISDVNGDYGVRHCTLTNGHALRGGGVFVPVPLGDALTAARLSGLSFAGNVVSGYGPDRATAAAALVIDRWSDAGYPSGSGLPDINITVVDAYGTLASLPDVTVTMSITTAAAASTVAPRAALIGDLSDDTSLGRATFTGITLISDTVALYSLAAKTTSLTAAVVNVTVAPCPSGTELADTKLAFPTCELLYCAPGTAGDPCVECVAGTSAAAGSTACLPCAAGSFAPANRSSACTPCPAGWTTNKETGTLACVPCQPGTFSAASGQPECSTCPGSTYSFEGATLCTACPNPGGNCEGGILKREDGYWYMADSDEFYRCATTASCPAGTDLKGCSQEYKNTSFLCSECADDTTIHYARGASGTCSACPATAWSGVAVGVYCAAVLLVVVFMIRRSREKRGDSSLLLKIIINYCQMLSIVSGFSAFRSTSFTDMIGFTQFASASTDIHVFSCLFGYDFYTVLLIYSVGPLALLLSVGAAFFAYSRWRAWRAPSDTHRLAVLEHVRARAVNAVVVLLFIMYPTITANIFKVFQCRSDSGRLEADMTVTCYRGGHILATILGGVALAVYGLGIPALGATLLHRNRRALDTEAVRGRYRFLYDGLRPKCYMWEVIITLRKTAMVAVLVFGSASAVGQVLLGVVVMAISLGLHRFLLPYEARAPNIAETLSIVAVLITVFGGVSAVSELTSGFRLALSIILLILDGAVLATLIFLIVRAVRFPALAMSPSLQAKLKSRSAFLGNLITSLAGGLKIAQAPALTAATPSVSPRPPRANSGRSSPVSMTAFPSPAAGVGPVKAFPSLPPPSPTTSIGSMGSPASRRSRLPSPSSLRYLTRFPTPRRMSGGAWGTPRGTPRGAVELPPLPVNVANNPLAGGSDEPSPTTSLPRSLIPGALATESPSSSAPPSPRKLPPLVSGTIAPILAPAVKPPTPPIPVPPPQAPATPPPPPPPPLPTKGTPSIVLTRTDGALARPVGLDSPEMTALPSPVPGSPVGRPRGVARFDPYLGTITFE